MKRTYLVLFLFSLANLSLASSVYSDFEYDEAAFYSSFSELNAMDDILERNPTMSLAELIKHEQISTSTLSYAHAMFASAEPPLGVPSFCWGCCLGGVGIILVYIMTDGDKEEIKKSVYGLLVWLAIAGIGYGFNALGGFFF